MPAIIAVAAAIGYWLGHRQSPVPSDSPPTVVPRSADFASPKLTLPERCLQTAEMWQRQLGEGCRVLVEPPFALVGDLSTAQLTKLYDQTIAPAAQALASDYFSTAPHEPITLLCFNDEKSYSRAAQNLLGEAKPSPYGFYRPHGRVVVANLATGTGTLVHELTHALIDFDFPQLADWFNEGLSSLHEACRYTTDETGHVHLEGLVNWRLPGLQRLIAQRKLRPTAAMIAGDDFRGPLEGANYAHARYLCMYLQQQGKLTEFYHRYRTHCADDPQGLESFASVLKITDWPKFDRAFWKWAAQIQ
jgi:hypothetical protein